MENQNQAERSLRLLQEDYDGVLEAFHIERQRAKLAEKAANDLYQALVSYGQMQNATLNEITTHGLRVIR